MRVIWTETALRQLATIHEYIARTSSVYAEVTVRRIWDRSGQLEAFPESGRIVPEQERPDVRELIEPP